MAKKAGTMYCYLWEEVDKLGECKFGDHFVLTGQDPVTQCRKRIRDSLGVRKDKFDEGGINVIATWDVSETAEKVGRNKQHGKMDDYLRKMIGHRKGSTGDVHILDGKDMCIRVNQLLNKLGQRLIKAGLSTKQYEVAEEVLEHFRGSSRIVLAELCARFGKTIWSAAVAVELDVDIVIVASYVKTVFTSFGVDLTTFQQFANYEHVDAGKDGYQEKINEALTTGKKVFVYLSMCNGSKRQSRIDFLFTHSNSKMLIVDEADFGSGQKKQAMTLVDAIDETVYTIIMTGTNADRAVTYWPIDTITSVTYPELLIQKKETINAEAF